MSLRRSLLALLLVLGLAATTVIGHAATLNVTGSSLAAMHSSDRCTQTPVSVTHGTLVGAAASSVEVTVPADCHGRPGVLRLAGPPGADDVAFTLPSSGAVASVPVPGGFSPDAVTGVAMTLGTWGVATSWTYDPPAEPVAAVCTVTHDVAGWHHDAQHRWVPILVAPADPQGCAITAVAAGPGWGGAVQYRQPSITVRNQTDREVVWSVELDFTAEPFPSWVPRGFIGLGAAGTDGWQARSAGGCSLMPRMQIVGNPGSTQVLEPGEELTISFQITSAPVGGAQLVCP